MKLTVGDWVKVECLENAVARVTQIDERGVHVYIGKLMQNLYTVDFIKYLTKLPIKFKGFEVLERVEISDTRYVKETDKMYHFTATPSKSSTLIRVFISLFVDGNWAYVVNSCSKETFEQAKDWLELQYATMIAKARGMV